MSLARRIHRLERAAQDAVPKEPNDFLGTYRERIETHPDGPALMAELNAIMRRSVPEGCNDIVRLRQAILSDPRSKELSCQLAEIQGGLSITEGRRAASLSQPNLTAGALPFGRQRPPSAN
jgi:hypothetical protein